MKLMSAIRVFWLHRLHTVARLLPPMALVAMALACMAVVLARPVYAATIIVTNTNDSGSNSLRQAVNSAAAGDTIVFSPAVFNVPQTITLSSGPIVISKSLTIDGRSGGVVTPTISGGNSTSIFHVNSGSTVILNALMIVNGNCLALCESGGVYNAGVLTISNSMFISNTSAPASKSGAIYNDFNGTLSVSYSTFLSNTSASGNGGAIGNSGKLSVMDSSFRANRTADGGGLYNDGTASVIGSVFVSNTATSYGGAIYTDGSLIVTGTSFVSNTGFLGGGVSMYSGDTALSTSTFTGNGAQEGGGAFNVTGTLTINGSSFESNTVSSSGGGIYSSGFLTVSDSTFTHDIAGYGGGLDNDGPASVMNSQFFDNRAGDGGGIYNYQHGGLSVSGSTFTSNTATFAGGGGIYNYHNLTVSGSTFVSNTTTNVGGGGLRTYGGGSTGARLKVINSTFVSNTSLTDKGGGVYVDFGQASVVNSTFDGNSAGSGGAVYNGNGTTILTNTIVALNPGGNCAFDLSGTNIVDGGHNLDTGASCTFSATGSLSNTNPILGPLQVNPPGHNILTVALLPGSPAIDHANDAACPSTDERGVPRPIGAHCDIGAFEFFNPTAWLYLPLVQR